MQISVLSDIESSVHQLIVLADELKQNQNILQEVGLRFNDANDLIDNKLIPANLRMKLENKFLYGVGKALL